VPPVRLDGCLTPARTARGARAGTTRSATASRRCRRPAQRWAAGANGEHRRTARHRGLLGLLGHGSHCSKIAPPTPPDPVPKPRHSTGCVSVSRCSWAHRMSCLPYRRFAPQYSYTHTGDLPRSILTPIQAICPAVFLHPYRRFAPQYSYTHADHAGSLADGGRWERGEARWRGRGRIHEERR